MSEPLKPPPLPARKTVARSLGEEPGMRVIMPVGRSGFAIAAGYLGLFSVLVFPAPFSILFGILAIRDIRRSRDSDRKKYGMGRAIFGIVMGSLVLLTVFLFVAST